MALYALRALDRARWPGVATPIAVRASSPFRSTWRATLDRLGLELNQLEAHNVVLEVAYRDRDIRVDGELRADAKTPDDPGVVLSFESVHGPLRYGCDRFVRAAYRADMESWQHNVRAIALGLEALRKVERYGIASRGEQYSGWKQLPSGIAVGNLAMSKEEAASVLLDLGDGKFFTDRTPDFIVSVAESGDEMNALSYAFHMLAKELHPDRGGAPEPFDALMRARRALLGK